jgi:hypothetical protein
MILSHKHKFIFLKTGKTAGTSMEVALSKFCGPDDIITPIMEEQEIRKEGSYPEAQNYMVPWYMYQLKDLKKYLIKRKKLKFYNHMKSDLVKRLIGDKVWNSYFKFCFERNPWDKTISGFYFKYQDHKDEAKPTLSEFIRNGEIKKYSSYSVYTINDEVVVDKVFLFENLNESITEISNYLNLSEPLELPKIKSTSRKDRRHYREVLSESDRDLIAQTFHREIKLFGYEY